MVLPAFTLCEPVASRATGTKAIETNALRTKRTAGARFGKFAHPNPDDNANATGRCKSTVDLDQVSLECPGANMRVKALTNNLDIFTAEKVERKF